MKMIEFLLTYFVWAWKKNGMWCECDVLMFMTWEYRVVILLMWHDYMACECKKEYVYVNKRVEGLRKNRNSNEIEMRMGWNDEMYCYVEDIVWCGLYDLHPLILLFWHINRIEMKGYAMWDCVDKPLGTHTRLRWDEMRWNSLGMPRDSEYEIVAPKGIIWDWGSDR